HVRRNVNRLRQHPPPRCFVILRDGVAAVVCLARSAKTVPQCVSCSRARNEIPGRFVEHREVQVHPLHVLCRTSSAVCIRGRTADRKSTRLNSSHQIISYAVFCLKKKKNKKRIYNTTYILIQH